MLSSPGNFPGIYRNEYDKIIQIPFDHVNQNDNSVITHVINDFSSTE